MPAGRFPPPSVNAARQTALQKAVKLAPGQSVHYTPGRPGGGYYAAPRTAARPPAVRPPATTQPAAANSAFTPLTGAEIANRIAGYSASLPAPLTDAQISERAQGQIDPLIASLTTRAQAQGKAASGAIGGYANSLANSLASYGDKTRDIYGAAQQGQAAADAAETGAVRGTGNELASQLSAKLAALQGGPGLDAATSGVVASDAAGGANAMLGTGSAALAELLARGSAAQDEAAKQPGFARAQGLADIRDVTMAGNKTLADQIAGVTDQLPGILSGLRDQSATRQSNIASGSEQLRQYLEGNNRALVSGNRARADTLAANAQSQKNWQTSRADTKAANAQARADALAVGKTKATAAVTVAQTKADAAVKVAQDKAIAAAAKTAASDAKPNAALSRAAGMILDSNGNKIPGADGKPQILPGFKAGPNGTAVKATATPAAATAASLKSANSTALSIIQKAAKVTVTTAAKGGGPFGGAGKATKTTVTPVVGSEAYYRAIHQAEAAIEPLVPADWTPAQITSFVQRLANKFFKG